MKSIRIAMQVLMSDSLLNRVSTVEPTSEKLLANFVLPEDEKTMPITTITWEKNTISKLGIGLMDIKALTFLLSNSENIGLTIEDLDIYIQNIFSGTYKLLEHDNYSYELLIDLESNNG